MKGYPSSGPSFASIIVTLFASLALVFVIAEARANKRVALVVGNDRYPSLGAGEQLQKAVNDAQAVAGALTGIGFEVLAGENLGRRAFLGRLGEFTSRLDRGDTALFFFSGHGIAIDGVNYVLPTDVPDVAAGQETLLKGEALGEPYIISELTARGVWVAVVVLDACRTNPFRHAGDKGLGGEKGLAPPPQVKGVFSLYAASAGQAARDRLGDDDRDPNSVFSRVLVPALTRPGLDLAAVAVDVRQEVARIAQGAGYDQQPAYYDGLTGRLYLAGLPPLQLPSVQVPSVQVPSVQGPVAPVPQVRPAADEVAWSLLKDTRDADQLRRFIAQFPASPLRREAEEQLKTLMPADVAMLAPARPAEASPPPGGPCGSAVTVSAAAACTALTAAQERALKPKDTFRECDRCPEMVVVPAGSFTMGSPPTEAGHKPDEGPPHVVTIARAFAVGKLHVTRDQYAAFVEETQYAPGTAGRCSWRSPRFAQEGSHPVVCVAWEDARAYVEWMAKKTEKPYRLLTEAEFEYAARGRTSAGTYPRFWFGDDERALCRYSSFCTRAEATFPAGDYPPNPFGLFDMLGNAWQWTSDCYHDSYNGAPVDGSVWTAGGTCVGGHVIRGGSWGSTVPEDFRVAVRRWDSVAGSWNGFRVARTLVR